MKSSLSLNSVEDLRRRRRWRLRLTEWENRKRGRLKIEFRQSSKTESWGTYKESVKNARSISTEFLNLNRKWSGRQLSSSIWRMKRAVWMRNSAEQPQTSRPYKLKNLIWKPSFEGSERPTNRNWQNKNSSGGSSKPFTRQKLRTNWKPSGEISWRKHSLAIVSK